MDNKNFGPRLIAPDSEPKNFPLEEITVPIYLCYSTNDLFADVTDVQRLIPMLNNTADLCVQKIEGFNHLDFVQSVNAKDLIYKNILSFFAKHTCC